jgi:hypothetical protein
MIGKNERKKRIRKIGVLVVFGIFAALMFAQPVAAANYDTLGDGYVGNGAAERIFFDNTNGEIEILAAPVGIGDTSPDFKLEVTGSSGNGYFGVTSVSDGDIFVITSGGNVGIGITTFSTKFHVLQTTAADAFRVDDMLGDTTPFVIDQDGKVGIGIASPSTSLHVDGDVAFGDGSELTISGGTVTATDSYHTIDTEGNAGTDDLETINGGSVAGEILIIRADNSGRDVVAKDGTGNLRLEGHFTMDNAEDTLTLIFDGSNWLEISRSDNGA